MGLVRETVYNALIAQLRTSGVTFKTYSRRWKSIWDDPAARVPDLPMLIQQDQSETLVFSNRGAGGVYTLEIKVELYAKIPDGETPGVPDSTTPGSSVINPLIDAVFTALAPDSHEGVQTLSNTVIDCRIEGQIMKAFGDEDPSGLCGAIIPVRIQVLT